MSEPRFTPRQAVENRLKARRESLANMRVGKKVLIVWSEAWAEQLSEALDATPAPHTMFIDTFWIRTADNDQGGVSVVFAPIGAPGTVMIMEDLIALGAESIVGVGASGGLDSRYRIGDVLVPETVNIVDEGTSAHYPGEGDPSADPETLTKLNSLLAKHGVNSAHGDWWTTDAFYREMTDDIESHIASGILGIDMETSAMYRVAEHRGISCCNMLIVSDELWTDWNYGVDFSTFANGLKAMQTAAVEWALS